MEMTELFDAVAGMVTGLKGLKPLLVAIDGVDCAGKTRFADGLSATLRAKGHDAERLSLDRFHKPRALRIAQGELSPAGYYEDAFDLGLFSALALQPARRGRGTVATGVHDLAADAALPPEGFPARDSLVLVVDGVFLHRPELFPHWDLSVYLHVPLELALARALVRDLPLLGSPDEILRRYRSRYLPAQSAYIAAIKPHEKATLLIDNSDPAAPFFLRPAT